MTFNLGSFFGSLFGGFGSSCGGLSGGWGGGSSVFGGSSSFMNSCSTASRTYSRSSRGYSSNGSAPTSNTGNGSAPTSWTGNGSAPTSWTGNGSAPACDGYPAGYDDASAGDSYGWSPSPSTGNGSAPTPSTGNGSAPTPSTGNGSAPTPSTGNGSAPWVKPQPAPQPKPQPAPRPVSLPGYQSTRSDIDRAARTYNIVDKGDFIHIAPEYAGINTRHIGAGYVTSWNPCGKPVVVSPIAIDTNGDGKIGVTGQSTAKDGVRTQLGKTVMFDIDGDGKKDKIEWMNGGGDALLVDNRDGMAAKNMDGTRLFGDLGGQYANGYEKLAKLDTNHDGKLTGAELDGLSLWHDNNSNAHIEKGEMVSAREAGVTEISVTKSDVKDAAGATMMRSSATINGRQTMTEDVWFGKAR